MEMDLTKKKLQNKVNKLNLKKSIKFLGWQK